jgi:DNA-binding response OmpR family regulator
MGAGKPVLIVDDETKITDVVRSYLEKDGYEVTEAHSGRQALEVFRETAPGLVILDLMLPDIPGEEVLRAIRKTSDVPAIMLTAKIEEADILKGLDIGADDYVTKPFSPRQLVARVKAVLRRASAQDAASSGLLLFNGGDLTVDLAAREVRKSGKAIGLTPTEYKILLVFLRRTSKVFTREELINAMTNDGSEVFDRTVDSHI